MGEKDPCPTLLGINWAYDKYGLIDLKKKTMTFESDRVRVIIYVITVDESSYDDPIMNEKWSTHSWEIFICHELYT